MSHILYTLNTFIMCIDLKTNLNKLNFKDTKYPAMWHLQTNDARAFLETIFVFTLFLLF